MFFIPVELHIFIKWVFHIDAKGHACLAELSYTVILQDVLAEKFFRRIFLHSE